MNCRSRLTAELTALWMLCSQVPTECERSPSLSQHVQEKTSSWDATCPVPWTASPMWWSGSSMECLFPFLSTFASTLLMWTRNMQVRCQHVCTVTSNQRKNVCLFEAIYCYEIRLSCGNTVGSDASVLKCWVLPLCYHLLHSKLWLFWVFLLSFKLMCQTLYGEYFLAPGIKLGRLLFVQLYL